MKHVAPKQRRKSVVWTILGILAELMLTAAAVCALYIAWQMWWTGVQAEHNQIETRQSVSWSDPGQSDSVTIAQAQEGDPPAQPQSAQEGELIAQVYIPRFGSQWQRNLVEGTSLTELNKHGLGHYKDSQMPGQVGNFAFAGHRNGYGQPLGDVDKLQEGDPIIVRTQDYWYVYHYTSYKIVLPTDIVVNPVFPKSDEDIAPEVVAADAIPADKMGLDIGPDSQKLFHDKIVDSKTVVWNGPMGVFEVPAFAAGTEAVAQGLVDATAAGAFTSVGGGDSASAVRNLGFPEDGFSHISTGGGASLEFLEGKELPGLKVLD